MTEKEQDNTRTTPPPTNYGGVNFENLRRMLRKLDEEHHTQTEKTLRYIDRVENYSQIKTVITREDTQFADKRPYLVLQDLTLNGDTFRKGETIHLSTKTVADKNMIALGFVKMVDE